MCLALEDTRERVKRRLKQRGGCFSNQSAPITMREGWNRLEKGGLDDLNEWMMKNSTTKLILSDTVGRLANVSGSYDAMTREDCDLSRFGHAHHIAILGAHHVVKNGKNKDPFSDFRGSVGIGGGADTLLLLDRPRFNSDGRLCTTGEDVEEVELGVRSVENQGTWLVTGQASDVCAPVGRQLIREIVANSEVPATPDGIRWTLEESGVVKLPGAIRVPLTRMVGAGGLRRVGRAGVMSLIRTSYRCYRSCRPNMSRQKRVTSVTSMSWRRVAKDMTSII